MGKQCAGCVPVRRAANGAGWEVLLVESRWTKGIWLFPKGGIEADELPKVTALRETREEAGVIGRCGPKLGTWKFESTKQVQKMFLLFVEETFNENDRRWKERGKRNRQWLSLDDAKTLIKTPSEAERRPELLEILKKARKTLKKLDEGGDTDEKAADGEDDADHEPISAAPDAEKDD
uniref:Nudix hydrolase domain-containing protein n=1 Tax=Erythrolobus madagascarensis TaxID=708628 RepID=A0A7S0T5L5_9RHOD|mmetsp:Transcript_1459/g.3036  ORF Transcript_1459/g.3036 Transcript_1459/m.3036 type:complete len:178 (+) Transcript_1459:81-614(+)